MGLQRTGHAWATPRIVELAKIHAAYDAGQQAILEFQREHKISKDNWKFEHFNDVGSSTQRDKFDEMIRDPRVRAYRHSLEALNDLNDAICRSARQHRPLAKQFPREVREMTDLETPPKALFELHGKTCPIKREELIGLAEKCRRIYNVVRHISDIRKDEITRYKSTWRYFFENVPNLTFNQIIKIYEKMLSVLEFVEVGSTTIINSTYLETQLRKYTDEPLQFAKPEIIKQAIGANQWTKYIEVEHQQEFSGEDDERLAIHHLDHLTRPGGPDYVIEINGEGGLGKTKLAREYILRSIDRNLRYRQEPFEYYLYYTAKSEQQGEVTAAIGKGFTESPDDWAVGGGDYIHKLSFNQFIEVACRTFDLPTADAKEQLLEYLFENEILILLDNFEDVNHEDIAKYRNFFKKINAGTKSRILITSRRDPTYGRADIRLSRFNREKAVEMLYERYLFEISSGESEWRTTILNQLRLAHQTSTDIVGNIIDTISLPENEGAGLEALERNLTHPLYLRLLANILANPKVMEATESERDLVHIICQIIDDQQFGFWQWHDNVIRWMLKHAYEKIQDNIHTKQILLLLQQHPNGIDRGDIYAHMRNEFPNESQLLNEIEKALRELGEYGCFLEDTIQDGVYVLTNNARKFMLELLGIVTDAAPPNSEAPNGDQERINFEQELTAIRTGGVRNWRDIEKTVALLQQYTKNKADYDKILFDSLEKMCFDFVTLDSPSLPNVGVFIELLRTMKQTQRRCKLVIRNSAVLAEDEAFSGIKEEVEFLARIVMDDAEKNHDMMEGVANSPHAGTSLILIMKILSAGVQGNIHILFEIVNSLLVKLEEDLICKIIEDYGWHEEFGAFLADRALQLDWSLTTQNLFDLHVDDTLIESRASTSRFKLITPHDIQSSWNVVFHSKGEQHFEGEGRKAFTTHWDLISSTITLYVLPKRTVSKTQVLSKSVGVDGTRFDEWTNGGGKNQPGLSTEPFILAADISMALEMYNEISFDQPVGFSRAERFKKLFKQIYKRPISALSVAFIIGIRLDNSRPVTAREVGEQLVDEHLRRLNKFDDSVSPNEFYNTEEISSWSERFGSIVDKAVAAIETDDKNVRDEVERRTSQTSSIRKQPISSVLKDLIASNKIKTKENKRTDFILPRRIEHVLKLREKKPMIRQAAFKEDMYTHGGDLHRVLKHEESVFRIGEIDEWKLHKSWIESTISVIWNLSEDLVKSYTYDADLKKKIEDYHYNKFMVN